MRTKVPLFFFLLASLMAGAAAAGEFWQEKQYRRWSERECRKLLADSPWAKRYVVGRAIVELLGRVDPVRAGEPSAQMEYQVRLLSALPIRQAMVRLAQLNQKYDQMPSEKQQAFDQQVENFVAASFVETVVVDVAYRANMQVHAREMAYYWQSQTADTLKNRVFLLAGRGLRIPPLDYIPAEGGGGFRLVFPRQYEGQPLVSQQDKKLQLEFPHPNIQEQGEVRVLIEFDVKKMLLNGEVIY